MMKPKEGRCRLPGQWPFDEKVTTCICRHAGREASAMLYVALYNNKAGGLDADAALQAVYYEPFAYWDWHGLHIDDESASKHKKQLLWERQRGFTANGEEYGYPTPRDAWVRFRRLIGNNKKRSHWVKKIAVAHWMNVEDITWIFENLPSLEALDLSDIACLTVKPNKACTNEPETMTDTWALFFNRMREKCPAKDIALQLKWLGLPDFRDSSLVAPLILLKKFLPICTSLQTISIRGKYREEIPPSGLSGHEYVCNFTNLIRTFTPPSVTALELRLSVPFMSELLLALHAESKLNINQIGLDLGAWVQVYPLRITSGEMLDGDVVSAASKAARKARFEIYQEEHNKILSTSSKWLLPAPEEDPLDLPTSVNMSGILDSCVRPDFEMLDAKPAFQYHPYGARGGSDIRAYNCDWSKLRSQKKCANADPKHHDQLLDGLERTHINTLPAMLVKLHDAGRIAASQDYGLYPLQPEWQANSTTPLHPFTLIQKYQPLPTSSAEQGRDYKEPLADRLKDAYAWLNTTFAWRPVVDWDCFVRPYMENLSENLDAAFKYMQQQYGLKSDTKSNIKVLVAEVAKHFHIMRTAGIPIHILLARRNPDESSLYWGWPYNSVTWDKSLKAPFDVGLAPVAAHIDALSIFYDLRNPLDERRLREIDRRQPYLGPNACCPLPYPEKTWRDTKNNPFKEQWQDRPSKISKSNTQRTANKKFIGKKFVPLASNSSSCPPTGEYADEHTYDDSGSDSATPETLHQVARRAAFEREAVGWQRFWTEYASQLTNLKELRVRMPYCFDRVGSWSLCKLLEPKTAWRMFGYADERGHMQTRQDLVRHIGDNAQLYTHAVQDKIWPAGRFVRRTWSAWTPALTDTAEAITLERGTGEAEHPAPRPSGHNGINHPPEKSKSLAARGEREEFEKAVKQAQETARKEKELEALLPLAEPQNPVVRNPMSRDIEERLTGTYGRHIRTVAQRAWRAQIRGHVEQLQNGEPARDKAVNDASATGNDSSTSKATVTRDVLRNTRERLQERIHDFRPEDVFAPCDRSKHRNGVDLVDDTTEYAAEESKRRAGLAKENAKQTDTSKSTLPSTGATTASPRAPKQLREDPIEISSEESTSDETSSEEDDIPPERFAPAVTTRQVTAAQTVTTQQGPQTVRITQTTCTTKIQQQVSTERQLELAQQLAKNLAAGQAQKILRVGKEPKKPPIEGEQAAHKTSVGFPVAQKAAEEKRAAEENRRSEEQAAEKQRLVEEKRAAEKARTAAETIAEAAKKKAVEEKNKADEVKKHNAEMKKQAATEKKKAKDDVAAARKKAKDDVAAAKKLAADKEAARKEAEQKAANETAEATEIAAIKAKEAAATIKVVNTEGIPDIIPSIEKTPPAKPIKKPTKSPKNPRGTKRKEPSPDPSDDDLVEKPPVKKKPRPSKEPLATSTPLRRSTRLRTRTPTTQVELPSDVSVTESSGSDTDDDNDEQRKRRKGKKDAENASDYESPGSPTKKKRKKKTPTRGAKAALGGRKAVGKGGKAAGAPKGTGKGKKRAAADDDEEEDKEVVKKKPVKKKSKKVDEDGDEYNG